jgi:hypothetical protein
MNTPPPDHFGIGGGTAYIPGATYRNRSGVEYVADQSGALRRASGGKLGKAERKAVRREAVRELKQQQRGGR